MRSPFGRINFNHSFGAFRFNAALLALACTFVTSASTASRSGSNRLVDDSAGRAVIDFYETREVRNALTTPLLERATGSDVLSLKKELASIERGKKQIRLSLEDGQLRVSDQKGKIIAEISGTDSTIDPTIEKNSFLLNEKPLKIPVGKSRFQAIRSHLSNTGEARSADASSQAALPIYLYIDFHEAQQTPSQGHSVLQEVRNQAQAIKSLVMPGASNAFSALAQRLAFQQEGRLTCEGTGTETKATGVARIDGEMHRFESRTNGDVILTPAFREAPAVRLRPSLIDFALVEKQLSSALDQFAQIQTPQAASQIIDGPVRTICERITMLKIDPKIASICERAYVNRLSIEGRCLAADLGPQRSECERQGGRNLNQDSLAQFEKSAVAFVNKETSSMKELAKSVANVKVIARQLNISECADGITCRTIATAHPLDLIRPAPPAPSSKVKDLLGKRHSATGDQALVRYNCGQQSETCSNLVATSAANRLPAEERDRLIREIRDANLDIFWRKVPFLKEASALRPLGQCCNEAECKEQLTKEIHLKVHSNPKGIAK